MRCCAMTLRASASGAVQGRRAIIRLNARGELTAYCRDLAARIAAILLSARNPTDTTTRTEAAY